MLQPRAANAVAVFSTAAVVSGVCAPSAAVSSKPMRIPRRLAEVKLRPATGAESASPGSGPCKTPKSTRTSATVRAIGPTTPSQGNAPLLGGKWPVAGIRPGVGFSPQMPQKCAGTRTEPPPSLPTPPAEQPAAMAAASPPLEPPAEYARFHGLLVRLPPARRSAL